MNNHDAIVHAIRSSAGMVAMFAQDLSAEELLHRPCAGGNCAAWIVGHLVLSDRRMLAAAGLGTEGLPPLPEGFEKRFARDDTAPKSADYGDTSALLSLFTAGREEMARIVAGLDPARVAEPLPNGGTPLFRTVGEMLNFAGLHAATHAGQISTIRRSLGRPPIV